MVTFLVTSVLVLGLIAIAIYFWQKPANQTETIELPPPAAASLFTNEEPTQIAAAEEEELSTPDQMHEQQSFENDEARANRILAANAAIESWRNSPDRSSTAKMLHAAALTDDANIYTEAVENAVRFWQSGKIPDLSAMELQTLLNGQFWVLSSSTRSSGAGFVLKRTLSWAKRELERANNPT